MPDGRAETWPDVPRVRRLSYLARTALPRNGLPEVAPYVYRGTGDDVLQGTYGDPLLDEPDT